MSNLPTGLYKVVLLRSYRVKTNIHVIDFVLVDTGERESCVCFGKQLESVLPYSGLVFVTDSNKFEWIQKHEKAPIMMLQLEYSMKYGSTRALKTTFTGETTECDIVIAAAATDFSEF